MSTQAIAFGPNSIWQRMADRSTAQQWPEASLYVVATPIGNLADLSLRAWQALMRCDVIAAEDTRATLALTRAWGIDTPLIAAHRHNEAQAAEAILERLQSGERVALVSDAGAPAVSDPGARIVQRVRDAAYRIIPIPGPTAAITALMASGATSDRQPAFVFAGFAPPKTAARKQWLEQWCQLPAPIVLFEAPHRALALVSDIVEVCGTKRQVTIARELTKRYEQIVTMAAGELSNWLTSDAQHLRGEFVFIVHIGEPADTESVFSSEDEAWADALLETVSLRDAARVFAKARGLSRDTAYRWLLSRQAGPT